MSPTSYQPPGVYVQGTAASVVTTGVVPTTTVTVVGPSRGYLLATESLNISTTAQALGHTGVLPDGVAVNLKVTKVDGTVLVETTDYVLVRGAGAGDATTIARASGSTAIADGDLVTVSYSYADTTYFAPKTFSDMNSVEGVYGPSLVSTAPASPADTQVSSPLSLAARLAFENGAFQVICVAIEPVVSGVTLVDRYNEAFAKVATNPDVTLLVPVFSQSSGQDSTAYTSSVAGLMSAARAHAVSAAAAGFGRIIFAGVDTLYNDASVSFETMAAAVSSDRVSIAFPNRMVLFNSATSQSTEVGGPYLAAALAGRMSAQAVNRGITRQQVFGFTSIPDDLVLEMTSLYKNSLSGGGVCVVEPGRTSQLVCRHGVSTDSSGDIVAAELSITRAFDVLFRQVMDGLDGSDLIGEPITEDTTTSVKAIITGILESALSNQVIAGYDNLLVRQQTGPTGNPTIVEIQFVYAPFLPLNYINVVFSMDLTTGVVTTTADDGTAAA